MTRDQQLQVIREAAIRANPEMPKGHWYGGDSPDSPEPYWSNEPVVRLADVLLAIGSKLTESYHLLKIEEDVRLVMRDAYTENQHELWNLRNDDLTAQSDETLDFLYNLLK